MAQQLAALGPASTEIDIKRNTVLAVKETARRLGNRPAACRKYYIHPAVFESYADQTLFSAMRNVPAESKTPAGKLSAAEVAVLGLVDSYMRGRNGKHAKAS
jgi:DNA topoisomerase-1